MRYGCGAAQHVPERAFWDVSVVGWAERVGCERCALLIRRVGSSPRGGCGALQIPALFEQRPELGRAAGVPALVGAPVGGLGAAWWLLHATTPTPDAREGQFWDVIGPVIGATMRAEQRVLRRQQRGWRALTSL
jgi:hypothetical protein